MTKRTYTLLFATILATIVGAHAQPTAFTYQGRLDDGGNPASGSYDMIFTLHDAASAGNVIGSPVTNAPTSVSNGLFTVTLDFGNQFPGAARWLEVGVRTNGGDTFTTLAPRQRLTPTPYAIRAINSATAASVSGNIPASQITGTVSQAQLPTSVITNGASGVKISGTFSGNGAGVTNLDLTRNSVGAIALFDFYVSFSADTAAVGGSLYSGVSADVNGDGRPDIITTVYVPHKLAVLTNNGSGGFALSSSPFVDEGPISVTTADVNGDGKPDLISANDIARTLNVVTNDGTGGFALASSLPTYVENQPTYVTSVDVNGDGKADVVNANLSDVLMVWTNNGSGGFMMASSPTVRSGSRSLTSADVNGDERPDLISVAGNQFTVLTNSGGGNFVGASTTMFVYAQYSITTADVNRDGKADLITVGEDAVTVFTNAGNGAFTFASSAGVGRGAIQVKSADLNSDGNPDLITVNQIGHSLTVLTNNGSSGFVVATSLAVARFPDSVISTDVNGDGRLDLVGSGSEGLTVLINAAVFTGKFVGDGSGLTSGTVADARLSTNVALLDSEQRFTGRKIFDDGQFYGAFTGNGAALNSLNASELASGTIPDPRLSVNVALLNGPQTFTGSKTFTSGTFNGNGAGLTALNASQLTSGTVPDARLSANVALLDGAQTFTGAKTFTAGTFSGNGAGLTTLNASQLASGTVPDARQSANVALLNSAQTFAATKTFTANTGLVVQAATTAIELRGGGALKVVGAGVNTTTPVFTHRATAGNTSGSETRIDHPLCNGRSDAILIITYNFNPAGLAGTRNDKPFGLYYNGTRWAIYNLDATAMPVGAAYNVLVFNP